MRLQDVYHRLSGRQRQGQQTHPHLINEGRQGRHWNQTHQGQCGQSAPIQGVAPRAESTPWNPWKGRESPLGPTEAAAWDDVSRNWALGIQSHLQ